MLQIPMLAGYSTPSWCSHNIHKIDILVEGSSKGWRVCHGMKSTGGSNIPKAETLQRNRSTKGRACTEEAGEILASVSLDVAMRSLFSWHNFQCIFYYRQQCVAMCIAVITVRTGGKETCYRS